MELKIRSLKLMAGQENSAFELELYINAERAARVSNTGRGGSHEYFWCKPELQRPFHTYAAQLKANESFEQSDGVIWDLIKEEVKQQEI